jgi:hypothetical protein
VRPSYFWVVPITIAWPLLALGVTLVRFGHLPGDGKQVAAAVLGFLLVGALSGLVLIFLARRLTDHSGRLLVAIGYIALAPFGYVFGIAGPLTLEAFDEVWLSDSINYFLLFPLLIGLYGSIPPICGAVVGLLISRIRERGS